MARKRMIDPAIWQSEDFSKLSTLAKLVFIGLFSLADDEGRGRANSTYLKSSLFPYEESLRSADIEKTLSEISSNMSVIFYSCDESNYYELLSWNTFQKIDRPTESTIPKYEESKANIRRLFVEDSSRTRRGLVPNRTENNKKGIEKKEKEFTPPTLDDVKKYVQEKSLNVNAEHFYNYFSEGNWVDSKGNKVKNWKQKMLTWNGYADKKVLPMQELDYFGKPIKQKFQDSSDQYGNLDQKYVM